MSTPTVPQTGVLDNPYWEIVATFPHSDFSWQTRRFTPESNPGLMEEVRSGKLRSGKIASDWEKKPSRANLVNRYAWAIPTDDTIIWLADQLAGRDVVEIGAGTGYWAWLLEQRGVTVVCYDTVLIAQSEKNTWFQDDTPTFHAMLRGDASAVARHPDKVLMLCWPPYSNSLAADALAAYQGDTVVYVGESEGGCCADDDFFRALGEEWTEVQFFAMTQWDAIHDNLWIYQRNDPSTVLIKEEP